MNSLENSVFDPRLPVKIMVHGYGGQFKSPYIIAAKNAILQAVRVFLIYVIKDLIYIIVLQR
jgi:hypothetical protein